MRFGKKKHSQGKWFERGLKAADDLAVAVSELVKFQIEDEELSAETMNDLLILNNALYYIFLDRQAFSLLENEERTDFSNGLLFAIATRLADAFKLPSNQWSLIMDDMNQQINILVPFSGTLMSSEKPAGTLYWEYSKILSSRYGMGGKAMASSLMAPQIGTQLWVRVKKLFPNQ
jgi:hypothetical protein